jgi:uncharacterized SAM-binding protein YcdF (DUF218 family)
MRRHAAWAAALGLVAVGVAAAPLSLEAIGRLLVVNDPMTTADAVYVFPGEVPRRAECAAQLVRAGVARRVVVSGGRVAPVLAALDLPLTDAEVNARLLRRHGVDGEVVTVLKEGTSTREDAEALRRWSENGGRPVGQVIAVTSPAHSRRAKRTLRQVFDGTGVEVRVAACPPALAPGWWRQEDTLVQVTDEVLKLLYYVIAY